MMFTPGPGLRDLSVGHPNSPSVRGSLTQQDGSHAHHPPPDQDQSRPVTTAELIVDRAAFIAARDAREAAMLAEAMAGVRERNAKAVRWNQLP